MNKFLILNRKIKYFVFITCILLISSLLFASSNNNSQLKTLLTIKLYSEPNPKDKKLTYFITLPEGETYSYYLGSDLPQWKYNKERIIQGEFHSVSLVNIRIHPGHAKLAAQNKVNLILLDPESARVVWQGNIVYPHDHRIAIKADIDNKAFYDTKIKIDQADNTVSLETMEK